jgi:hypothetical protein
MTMIRPGQQLQCRHATVVLSFLAPISIYRILAGVCVLLALPAVFLLFQVIVPTVSNKAIGQYTLTAWQFSWCSFLSTAVIDFLK